MGAQKIVIISAGQPSLNPRLVKEADALCNAGYEVTVLYAYWNDWGTVFDKQLIPSKKWKAICIGGDPISRRLVYFFSKIIYRFALYIHAHFKGKFLTDIAISRPALFLKLKAKRFKADVYIIHTLGALPAGVAAAKKYNRPLGFDAEDFHRNEVSDDANNPDVILKSKIEDKYFSQLSFFTTSSPQIADAYRKIYPDLKPVVLLNVFPKNKYKLKQPATSILKLFWFSQTIGTNRGIEGIIAALKLLNKSDFELHLLGNRLPGDESFINDIISSGITVNLHNPIPPDDIIPFASQFDIGLALENKMPYNRDICLTNKMFTYMQAGLAVITSDTLAQRDFIDKNPAIGRMYPKDNVSALANILLNFQHDAACLASCKKESLRLAQTKYNWETESFKFLDIVKQTLNN